MAGCPKRSQSGNCFAISSFALRIIPFVSLLMVSDFGHAETSRTTSQGSASREQVHAPAWCANILVGNSSHTNSIAVQTAVMHSNARFFAPAESYAQFERGLAASLASGPVANGPNLETYASFIDSACVVSGENAALAPLQIKMIDKVAWIRPGIGNIVIPDEAETAVIDLRGIPNTENLKTILEELIAEISAHPVKRGNRSGRVHRGMTDEVFSNSNVYNNSVQKEELSPFDARRKEELPVAVIVPQKTAPVAADFAISLRLARRAWIIGEDLFAGAAESTWYPVGSSGISFRTSMRGIDETPWPDRIRADYPIQKMEILIQRMKREASPPAITEWFAGRSPIQSQTPFGTLISPTEPRADLRAALVSVYGAVRIFDPDYAKYGDSIDARFHEVIAQVEQMDASNRIASRNLLRRFGNSLNDGHNFVYDKASSKRIRGFFPVDLEEVDGTPVVRRSLVQGIAPGDTLVAINGVPMANWYAEEYSRVSADSEGYRFDLASRELLAVEGDLTVETRTPDGTLKVVNTAPYPFEALQKLRGPKWNRPSGHLGDLNAPELLYLNMAFDENWWSSEAAKKFSAAAKSAKGIVVDMRGYPTVNHYQVAQYLICKPFLSPQFLIPFVRHGIETAMPLEQNTIEPFSANETFCGPLVLLVGKHSVSSAEDFSTLLTDAGRVRVVGERSAATNGNITGIGLAGGFQFTFTGMDVRRADGSPFRGIGIVPDVEVKETVSDLAQGADPQLLRAVLELKRR